MALDIDNSDCEVERSGVLQFRLRTLFLLILVLSLLFTTGLLVYQWLNQQPTARVVLTYPGASPVECDEFVAWKLGSALYASNVDSWTVVSYAGRVEVYAIAVPGTDGQGFQGQFVQTVQSSLDDLPAGVSIQSTKLLASEPFRPQITIKQVDQFEINLSRDKTQQLGLTLADTFRQIKDATPESSTVSRESQLALEQTILKTSDGERIRLREIATINIVQKPNALIRRSH